MARGGTCRDWLGDEVAAPFVLSLSKGCSFFLCNHKVELRLFDKLRAKGAWVCYRPKSVAKSVLMTFRLQTLRTAIW